VSEAERLVAATVKFVEAEPVVPDVGPERAREPGASSVIAALAVCSGRSDDVQVTVSLKPLPGAV
jgi:hypothetical protein